MAYILSNLGQFETGKGVYDTAPLVAYQDALAADMVTVKAAASNALNHPKDAKNPVLTAVASTLPARKKGETDAMAVQAGERRGAHQGGTRCPSGRADPSRLWHGGEMVRAFARLHVAAGSAVIVIVIATAWLAIFGVEHVYHPAPEGPLSK